MYSIPVSPTSLEQLASHARLHPHPLVRRRMLTVHLLAHGHSRTAVAQLLQITPKTVRKHLKLYRQDGITGLLTLKYAPRCGALDAQRDRIVEVLEEQPPHRQGSTCPDC